MGIMENYELPKQLVQSFMEVPCKMRLPSLITFLRARILNTSNNNDDDDNNDDGEGGESCKIVVFFSNCDAVDFHYSLFKEARIPKNNEDQMSKNKSSRNKRMRQIKEKKKMQMMKKKKKKKKSKTKNGKELIYSGRYEGKKLRMDENRVWFEDESSSDDGSDDYDSDDDTKKRVGKGSGGYDSDDDDADF